MLRRFFILFLLLVRIYTGLSQDTALIDIAVKNGELKQVFGEISRQSGLYFVYSPQFINDKQKITFIVHRRPLGDVLTLLADRINVSYQIIEKQIILKPLTPAPAAKSGSRFYHISGYVTDSATGQILIGANIIIDGKLKAFSNEYGFFSVKVTADSHYLKISYTGYQSFQKKLNVNRSYNLNIRLKPAEQLLDMVIVTADQTSPIRQNSLDFQSYTSQMINRNPGLGGTYDALKGLQALPGFNFYGDGSLIFHVRGGLKSQNLVLIDDAPIFNPVHLLGFFSAVSPYAVNNIRVYKNTIPAQYAGRTSAVIDIRIRDGDYHKWQAIADISPIISSYLVDGPLKKNKSSLLISLRRSHVNWLYENNYSQIKVNFIDTHVKWSFKPDNRNKFYVSLFYSTDKVGMTRNFIASNIQWGNAAATVRWNRVISPHLFVNNTFFSGIYSYDLQFMPDTTNIFGSMIFKTGLKSDFSYYKSENATYRFGFNASYYYFNPANVNQYAYVPSQNALEGIAYIGAKFFPTEKLRIDLGLDLRYWGNLGPTYLYRYGTSHIFLGVDTIGLEIYNNFVQAEPRLSISYSLSPKIVTQFSAGRYVQFLQLLSNSISPFTTVEAWMPASPNIPPIITNQIALGLTHKSDNLNFTVETYFKTSENVVAFSNFSSLLFNPYIEGDLRYGRIYSAGLELSASRSLGQFNYWVSYTYSRSFMQIPEIWLNQWFSTSFDKPHNFYANVAYNTKRMQCGVTLIASSGNRFTAPIGFYEILDHTVPLYGLPNNATMPYYMRLDVFLKYKLNKRGKFADHYLTFSVFNLTGRKNAVLVNFNKVQAGENFFYVPTNYIYEHELTPSYYYLLRAVPMLNYTVKFKNLSYLQDLHKNFNFPVKTAKTRKHN